MNHQDQSSGARLIAIVLPNLGGGGTERVHLELAREFISAGYAVEFVLLQLDGALLNQAPAGVTIVGLGVTNFRHAFGPIRRYVSQRKPAFVMAAMWPLTAMTLLAVRSIKYQYRPRLLLSEHVDFIAGSRENRLSKSVMRYFGRWIYANADEVVCVSAGASSALSRVTGFPENNINTVYNPVRAPEQVGRLLQNQINTWWLGGSHKLVSAGRLTTQKDHSTLIRAMSLVPSKLNARLLILGEGPERDSLAEEILALGLQDRVKLAGFVPVPNYLNEASLFVLSSRWEGMAVVLVEALLQGVPIVSTDCPSGPAEVLDNGKYGRLVPIQDPRRLADAIVASLNSRSNRQALQERGLFFDPRKVGQQYLRLLDPTFISNGTTKGSQNVQGPSLRSPRT